MTGLWLSVRELMVRSDRSRVLDAMPFAHLDGIHVDVHADDKVTDLLGFLRELEGPIGGAPVDVHFVHDRSDAEIIATAITEMFGGIRNAYSPRRNTPEPWTAALSAREVALGNVDALLRPTERLLITAPSGRHGISARVEIVAKAIKRIEALSGSTCEIVLDRDVDDHLATRCIREAVAEIVVGKAILRHPRPLQSIAQIRLAWKVSQ